MARHLTNREALVKLVEVLAAFDGVAVAKVAASHSEAFRWACDDGIEPGTLDVILAIADTARAISEALNYAREA